jgi:hypothetical protein
MNKSKLLNLLLQRGYYLAKTDSSREELLEFISLLKPYDVGIPLIRIGSKRDGGYLIPDDLQGVIGLLSPGVGNNSDFEFDLANRGIKCFLADYSVNAPVINHSNFHFIKKYIGDEFRGENYLSLEKFLRLAKNTMMLESCDSQSSHIPDLILSMDIEGYELETLLSASDDCLDQFRIIVMELHFLQRIFHEPLSLLYRTVLRKLLKNFYVCHIHPNNGLSSIVCQGVDVPPLLEITFINRKRVKSENVKPALIPHPLDTKTVIKSPDLHLSSLYLP